MKKTFDQLAPNEIEKLNKALLKLNELKIKRSLIMVYVVWVLGIISFILFIVFAILFVIWQMCSGAFECIKSLF